MKLQQDVDLSSMNTLRLPSTARYFLRAESERQVFEAVAWARRQGLGLLVLGAGSNVVLPRRVDALVLNLVNRGIDVVAAAGRRVTVNVAAGESWHRLVSDMLHRGLHGLENLALIPGAVGAAPVQNIGAYGVELEQFVISVRALDTATMTWLELTRGDCDFSYRGSLFRCRPQRYIISQLRLDLSHSSPVNDSYAALGAELRRRGIERALPADVYDAVVAIRQRKLPDPRVEPNAGSFFKNPFVSDEHYRHLRQSYPGLVAFPQSDGRVKLAAAWLIDQAGFKGKFQKGLGMHPQQALVLVNRGSEDSEGVLKFADEVARTVQSLFAVSLQCEPLIVHSDGSFSTSV